MQQSEQSSVCVTIRCRFHARRVWGSLFTVILVRLREKIWQINTMKVEQKNHPLQCFSLWNLSRELKREEKQNSETGCHIRWYTSSMQVATAVDTVSPFLNRILVRTRLGQSPLYCPSLESNPPTRRPSSLAQCSLRL